MLELIKQAFLEWRKDNASMLAASLSFYSLFSLIPLLIMVIMIAGAFFGESAVQRELLNQIGTLLNEKAASALKKFIENSYNILSGVIYPVVGFLILIYGATKVFVYTRMALNIIWDVSIEKKLALIQSIKTYFLSFLLVMGTALLLLLSLSAVTFIEKLVPYFERFSPSEINLFKFSHFIVFIGMITFMVGMLYWILPQVRIPFKVVWPGALLTAILFLVGNYFIGLFLSYSSFTSIFGAAASLVGIMLWVYYSAQIFLFGAEFTKVYAREIKRN
ncbi:MAG: YihY/virulence factor BrkB family protein [Candidatus Eremiobacteraeota bacterium]|nr:YihY/virulence factor BrkB family protein [Candidatus Eremiobacteraeota bacterium]